MDTADQRFIFRRSRPLRPVFVMSLVYLEVMVRCDHESQGRVCAEFVYAHTPNEAYDDAREDGWQIDPAADGDYCPKHRDRS